MWQKFDNLCSMYNALDGFYFLAIDRNYLKYFNSFYFVDVTEFNEQEKGQYIFTRKLLINCFGKKPKQQRFYDGMMIYANDRCRASTVIVQE